MSRLVARAHAVAFRSTMAMHGALGLPAMTRRERALYARVLLAAPRSERLEVFEWGSGHSTVWAARLLRAKSVDFHLHTVDNDRGWSERVHDLLAKEDLLGNVTQHLREFPPFWDKPGWDWSREPSCGEFAPATPAESEYVELPLTLGVEFGVMLVDARFRRRCLQTAASSVAPLGFVVLHDAQKPRYQGPCASYRHSRFFDSGHYYPLDNGRWQMWIGSPMNPMVSGLCSPWQASG